MARGKLTDQRHQANHHPTTLPSKQDELRQGEARRKTSWMTKAKGNQRGFNAASAEKL
jgi:hypothetical protein